MWKPETNAARKNVCFNTKHGIRYARLLQTYTDYVHVNFMDGFEMFIPKKDLCSSDS